MSFVNFYCNRGIKTKVKSDAKYVGADSVTNITSEQNKIFKNWLSDTLKVLQIDKSPLQANDDLTRRIFVSPDSLSLTVEASYDVKIDRKSSFAEVPITNLIELLKEYDELPKHEFELKFKTSDFFSPSPVPQLKKTTTFTNEDIAVLEKNDKISKYSYIRGRLSTKVITQTLKDGGKKGHT